MTLRNRFLVAGLAGMLLAMPALPARAGGLVCGTDLACGPNADFPDSNLVMPFAGKGLRQTFFALSNVGISGPDSSPLPVTWAFYDESGELLVEVVRFILGEGGTDIVDLTSVQSKSADGTLGPATNLSGRNGYVVVSKDDGEPDLVGNFTIANTDANASYAYGNNAAGLGFIGLLDPNLFLFGTTFNPGSLRDNLLMVLGVDDLDFVPTSLTGGLAPEPGEVVFEVEITLHSNAGDGVVGSVTRAVNGTALFASLQELFPGTPLTSSMTIATRPLTPGVATIGFYGQSVGPFGAGQMLRTELPPAS